MKRIALLGSSGSIGCSVLEVVRNFPNEYQVVGLAVNRSVQQVAKQAREFRVPHVAVYDEKEYQKLKSLTGNSHRRDISAGAEGLNRIASLDEADIVINAVVGSVGVVPTLRALESGKQVALANKESLVMAGKLILDTLKQKNGTLIPIDSEHSALHQCLRCGTVQEVRHIILTASGGPFWKKNKAEFPRITVAEALAHPTWNMGNKITIDSATLMNKGLEVIEAFWLFGLPAEKIKVVIHPESIIHSMVEYRDSSVICQLSTPDMRLPIQYALAYPERKESTFAEVDLVKAGTLTFYKPDPDKFRCLPLAYGALKAGGSMPCVLNAANEVVVESFLKEHIKFSQIPVLVAQTMDAHQPVDYKQLEELIDIDRWARSHTRKAIGLLE